jgi:hypothetical protein
MTRSLTISLLVVCTRYSPIGTLSDAFQITQGTGFPSVVSRRPVIAIAVVISLISVIRQWLTVSSFCVGARPGDAFACTNEAFH